VEKGSLSVTMQVQQLQIDPRSIGLEARDIIFQVDNNHFVLFIDRKSRIIMSDTPRLLNKVEKLSRTFQEAKISIQTTAPVCSKAREFLESQQVHFFQSPLPA
jgi:hypothetical protein